MFADTVSPILWRQPVPKERPGAERRTARNGSRRRQHRSARRPPCLRDRLPTGLGLALVRLRLRRMSLVLHPFGEPQRRTSDCKSGEGKVSDDAAQIAQLEFDEIVEKRKG